jgi:chaperonin cofactor prefoldin
MEVLMKATEVLKLLEKHEESCDKRYAEIQDHLKKLDNRLWMIVSLIIVASGLEQLL